MKRCSLLAIVLLSNFLFGQKAPVQYVSTLQGTDSKFELSWGNTFPATALPFAVHMWSPQTGLNGEGWKYQYSKDSIRGFQQSHQCSPWVSDYAVFTLMPVTGKLAVDQYSRAASFKHGDEVARPDLYKVKMGNGVTTEMSTTERGAHFRFSFPKKQDAFIVLDGYNKNSMVRIIPGERKIVGFVNNQRFAPANFVNYFVIVFDQPFTTYGTWENVKNNIRANNITDSGAGIGAYIQFAKGAVVQAKVASSYISPAQALTTLNRELGNHQSVDETIAASAAIWNKVLGNVKVDGGAEADKATFYSCLYRASLFSRMFYEFDADNKPYYYSPYDGKVHYGYMYTDNGFWDTFRSELPLHNLLYPAMQGRYMQALLDAQQQCGWLPSWSFPGETGGMLGNHAISLLTDAWVKGIRTFDPQQALKAYAHEAMNKGPWGGANGRAGWKEYYQLGYVPYPESQGSTAQTLEYAYDDFCGYELARLTGDHFYKDVFAKQMYNYKNVYDSSTGFMRGRKNDGSWVTPFDAFEWGGPYTEGNAWHWNWSVFHDIQGLINLIGGDEKFAVKLDSVFTQPNTVHPGTYGGMIHEMTEMQLINMGQYAHGNQPIQHMIYLYNYCKQPWKAQKHVREVMDKIYNASPTGFPGDEDQGQTSSWYVFSALGLYPVCPGTTEYVIGSPLFNSMTITLENGKQFTIEANNNSKENVYIQSATLNGSVLTKNFITHEDIINGGVLHLEMGSKPAMQRGIADADKPFSLSR
ncbi:GH92 family glycosyl hydrolase [Panacibacter sp. DH6]|uniref:GH92 family glycosyl hydrolase n=1 Tax=Panacibacter microcysteis TaxID=2793269 RepID=A0A931H073_9BACT|nr:GH92 family glycosyl hydrolase [Panacibacter microcysteis]MBG9378513.1 GH92 family glycosyl hydrolase [Panacibacter microcysteis]